MAGVNSTGGVVEPFNEVRSGDSPSLTGFTVANGTLTADTPNTITQTWNNSGVLFTALKVNVTNTASTTFSKLLDLQIAGSTVASFIYSNAASTGGLAVTGGVAVGGAQSYDFGGRSRIFSPANGELNFRNNADSAYAITRHSHVEIVDGKTAPTATSGLAKIYVDTADGDLKVIYGDGTIKTIVVDT